MDNIEELAVIEHIVYDEEKKQQLEKNVKNLESPFKWLPDRSTFSHVNPDYIIKSNALDEGDSQFARYNKYMHVVYELGYREFNEKWDEVWNKLAVWKEVAEALDDAFIQRHKVALNEIILGSEAYLLFKVQKYDKVEKVIQEVKKNVTDSDAYKAAICGMKAFFFAKYGKAGHLAGLPLVCDAIAMDKSEPKWFYIAGMTLRDIRRSDMYNINYKSLQEELELFKTALTFKEYSSYYVRLGNTTTDIAKFWSAEHKKDKENCFNQCCSQIKENCYLSYDYYRKAMSIEEPITRKTYLNVLRGINNMPATRRHVYKDKANHCVDKLLKFDSSIHCPDIHFAIGKHYQYSYKEDVEKYRTYFIRAGLLGSLNAEKELIMLRFQENQTNYNPCKDIIRRLEMYPDLPKKLESYSQIVSYYLEINYDIVKVMDAMESILEDDPTMTCLALRKHKSWFKPSQKHFDLFEGVCQEVSKYIKGDKEASQDIIKKFESFMGKMEVLRQNKSSRVSESQQSFIDSYIEKIKKVRLEIRSTVGSRSQQRFADNSNGAPKNTRNLSYNWRNK